jgi:hypothetical protein
MKAIILIILFSTATILSAQEGTKVLPLGTFHFKYPNNDVQKTKEEDQIDILDERYQKEIHDLVDMISRFEPTMVVIEREPSKQKMYDSIYKSYLNGKHELGRSEEQQIGFRLAEKMNLSKVYCVDEAARYYGDIGKVLNNTEHTGHQDFMDFFYDNPDRNKLKPDTTESILKTDGLIAYLKAINSDKALKDGLGKGYLTGIFKYETDERPFFGPDFVSGWWFDRNLRIFRNIQRIGATPKDRIVIIYGVGHMNLLNFFFDCSPEFKIVKVDDYLD